MAVIETDTDAASGLLMKAQGPLSISAIVAATGLSRATVDRVINKRPGVHPRTQAHVLRVIDRLEQGERVDDEEASALEPGTTHQLRLVIQASQAFTRALLDAAQRVAEMGAGAASLQPVASHSDEQTLELIRSLGPSCDGLAVVSKNTEPLKAGLAELRAAGKPVVALVSDLDAQARSAFVGIDNRAAGQLAGFLVGRCLERVAEAKVAVVVGYFAYRCHEDREIGFRALLRQRFPHIDLVEVLKGEDSPEATYDAARRLLQKRPDIAGLYNVSGGNRGLAQALSEHPLARRPLFISHEVNEVTEPLLRAGVIDFLITQDLDALVRTTHQLLVDLRLAKTPVRELNHLPFQLVSEFNLFPDAGNLERPLRVRSGKPSAKPEPHPNF
jgi:LacI family transcriptional regulator